MCLNGIEKGGKMNLNFRTDKKVTIIDNADLGIELNHKTKDFDFSAKFFNVLKGIYVSESNVTGDFFTPILENNNMYIEINYVIDGRAEFEMDDGCLQYLGQGDLFVSSIENHTPIIKLPLEHYSALSIIIDKEKANADVQKWLYDLNFEINNLFDKLFKNDCCVYIQSNSETRDIFASIKNINPYQKQTLYRLKVLEVLLFLSNFDIENNPNKSVFTRNQAEIVKEVHNYLTSNLDQQFTISGISHKFHISQTSLKTYFKAVYGKPIANYMKEYKIQQATKLLRESKNGIYDISLSLGYKSQSKFSSVFKEITGITPSEFRTKVNTKKK